MTADATRALWDMISRRIAEETLDLLPHRLGRDAWRDLLLLPDRAAAAGRGRVFHNESQYGSRYMRVDPRAAPAVLGCLVEPKVLAELNAAWRWAITRTALEPVCRLTGLSILRHQAGRPAGWLRDDVCLIRQGDGPGTSFYVNDPELWFPGLIARSRAESGGGGTPDEASAGRDDDPPSARGSGSPGDCLSGGDIDSHLEAATAEASAAVEHLLTEPPLGWPPDGVGHGVGPPPDEPDDHPESPGAGIHPLIEAWLRIDAMIEAAVPHPSGTALAAPDDWDGWRLMDVRRTLAREILRDPTARDDLLADGPVAAAVIADGLGHRAGQTPAEKSAEELVLRDHRRTAYDRLRLGLPLDDLVLAEPPAVRTAPKGHGSWLARVLRGRRGAAAAPAGSPSPDGLRGREDGRPGVAEELARMFGRR
jgi:hypothetical protein